MKTDKLEVSLDTLGSGAATELFDAEFQKVLDNIADPNTPWKTKRRVTLEVTIQPNEERSYADIQIEVKSKVAAGKGYTTHAHMGFNGQRAVAYENDPKQQELGGIGPRGVEAGGKGA